MENQAGMIEANSHRENRDMTWLGSVRTMLKRITTCLTPLILVAVVGFLVGCDDRPGRVQITGKVLIDGEPLTYGAVRFVPQGARPSSAVLDDEGRFTLSTYGENDGIIPGVHRVSVNAGESISDNERKWHAPPKYFRYQSSGLTQEITEDTETIEINLTWDGGKPFIERIK